MRRIITAFFGLTIFVSQSMAADIALELPRNYKSDYDNYLISDRLLQEDQVISLFANDIARNGAKTNGKLPYGSILIGEIYKVQKDANGNVVQSRLGRRIPTDLSAIVMMERRKGWDAQYPEELKVGDWEFEVFSPAGENLGKDTTACRECHHPLTDTEFTHSYAHIGGGN
ncbi:MAG: cytochrome P460 family protein [Hyphomicrobiales bacterium]|nr:cytochrome P460 family protein [Hyphomicrobiales bacterium]